MSALTLAPSHTRVLSAIVVLRAMMLSGATRGYMAEKVLPALALQRQ